MGVRVMAISLLQVSAHVIAEKGTILSDSALILQDYLASASATATATATVAPTMGLLPKEFLAFSLHLAALIGSYLLL